MSYTRTYVVDASPGGDTVKAAVATKLDGDLTSIYTHLNTHEALTTGAHGVGAGTIVGTTLTQTLTNKTLTSPALTTPTLGVATATSINKVAITAPATSATITITDGKTLTVSNTITFTATDGSTLAIGTGGTLGTAAYTATTAYEAAGGIASHAALITGVHGLVFTAGKTLTLTESTTINALGIGALAVATSANTIGPLAVGLATQILVGGGLGTVPAWGTDIPTGVTIGSAYVYRVGGTDVAVADGGTGVGTFTLNGILYGNTTTSVLVTAAGTAAGQLLTCGATPFVPAWTTATYPGTTTINQILYSSAANTVTGLATGNSGVLVTGGTGVPSIGTDIPTAVTIGSAYIYRAAGTDIPVTDGGTGVSTLTTAYGLLAAGTTATGAVQTLAAGATTEILVGGGTSALPVWTTATGTGAPVRAGSPTFTGHTIFGTDPDSNSLLSGQTSIYASCAVFNNVGVDTTNIGAKGTATGVGGTANYGVYGSSTTGGTTNYGVYGEASGAGTNWAGYFAGAVYHSATSYIGDTANAKVTLGLTVNQGAADDEILSLKSSDVDHTVTTDTEADTFGLMKKTAATAGGLTIRGLTDADAEGALTLEGIIGATDPTDTNAALVLIGSKQTGTTTAALAAAEEVLQIKNRTTDLVTVLGDGKVGINTTAPAAKLTLVDTSQSATNNPGNAAIKIYGTAVDTTNPEFLNVGYDPTLDAGYLQSIKTGVGGAFQNLLFCPNGGNVGIGGTTATSPLYVTGNAYFTADVSALTFTDRTPFYSGDALAEIAKVKGKDGKIDHASLPVFAQAHKKEDILEEREVDGKIEKVKVGEKDVTERNLGAMISILTVAVQQLTERLEKLEKK